jgi:integrase
MAAVKHRTFDVRERAAAVTLANAFRRELESDLVSGQGTRALKAAADRNYVDHVADFIASREGKGRDGMYVYNLKRFLLRLGDECGWHHLRDITADSLVAWKIRQKLKPKSIKGYCDALRTFCTWLVGRGRLSAMPITLDDTAVSLGGNESPYRAFTDAEISRLLASAPERRCVYLFALLTGLRRAEINSLVWEDVRADAVRPFVRARASTTKNAKAASLPLRDDVVAELRAMKPENVGDGELVFPDRVPSMELFRLDLAAASIPETDALGRRAVFHSFRHTFATNLCRAGVPLREAMEMMRHSDVKLTTKVYADSSLMMSPDTIERLPRYALEPAAVIALATGTDGNASGQFCGQFACGNESLSVSAGVLDLPDSQKTNRPELPGDCASLSSNSEPMSTSAENWGTRIRTLSEPLENQGQNVLRSVLRSVPLQAMDDDLRLVVAKWSRLPDAIRAAVLAIVNVQHDDG